MSRVASELGAATMSLYRHVSAKDELLAHMVDAVFADAPDRRRTRRELAARPGTLGDRAPGGAAAPSWLVRVPISGPPLMPNQVLWFERGLACLRTRGCAEAEKPSMLLLVNGFVRNQATLEADLLIAARISGTSPSTSARATARCWRGSPMPSVFRRSTPC